MPRFKSRFETLILICLGNHIIMTEDDHMSRWSTVILEEDKFRKLVILPIFNFEE